jgi:peptidoglycan-associated lipoprotein
MLQKIFPVVAVSLLVAACETPPATDGSVSGSGGRYERSNNSGPDYPSTPVTRGSQFYGDYDSVGELDTNTPDRVFFDYDSSSLDSEAREVLQRQAEWLLANPDVTVTVEGHCDERGTREYNLALGERRADAVRRYLMNLGVSGNRVSTISYGKERPAVVGANPNAWAQNRRGVTIIN